MAFVVSSAGWLESMSSWGKALLEDILLDNLNDNGGSRVPLFNWDMLYQRFCRGIGQFVAIDSAAPERSVKFTPNIYYIFVRY